ncbi:MAG: hypothetical protein PWP60_494 [Candidatus Atribacteria bacterium]|jgi:perosamine synthetase|uniref:DegT/DnrJ/EryC1/StrS family aminotransferase n=1 Tax=Atrimonas thermophila TaxID=3064161 RepID=UPI0024AC0013|nr:hypothetical protein [Candidatus Atribacteria bacterium]
MMRIPICKPDIGKEEQEAVQKVLASGHLAQGEEVAAFESEFAEYLGVSHAVATVNGTAALFVALKALGVSKGTKVVTTPFTFVATASAILQCGGVPVFCDVDEKTFNIDPTRLEDILKQDSDVRGIVVVHLFGLPCAVEEVGFLARKYGVFLVEDCAQAHGALYCGKKVGGFGEAGVFSFYPTKNMTAGEGGMIVTNSEELARTCRMLINHGSKKRYIHEMLGYNFRLTDIGAAIGRVQLRKLDKNNQRRRENARFYDRHLSDTPGIETPFVPEGYFHVYHQYTLRVKEKRNGLRDFLIAQGIGCEVYYPLPLHQQPFLQKIGKAYHLPVAEKLCEEVLSIPVHPLLSEEERWEVVESIRNFLVGNENNFAELVKEENF